MDQDTGRTPFQTTNWTLVLSASGDPEKTSALLQAYQSPINAYIRRSGHDHHAAADLTQEFIAKIVLERGLIDRAEPGRGRFRSFVKAALRNFLIDQHRRTSARPDRGPGASQDPALLDQSGDTADHGPHDAFDRQWAATLLARTLERVEEDCRRAQQDLHWVAFQRAVVEPTLRQNQAPTLADLGAQIGVHDVGQVSSMIQTVRRKFKRLLRLTVEETVDDPVEVDTELSDLKRFLGA